MKTTVEDIWAALERDDAVAVASAKLDSVALEYGEARLDHNYPALYLLAKDLKSAAVHLVEVIREEKTIRKGPKA